MATELAEKLLMVVELPPFGIASGLFVLFESYMIATLHPQQKKKPAAYSKFSKDKKNTDNKAKEVSGLKMSPQLGASLAYSLPFLTGASFLCYQFYTRYTFKRILVYWSVSDCYLMHSDTLINRRR